MSFLPRLLCYGHDELLLYTRKKILEQEFSVETCTHISELPPILARGPVEVAVLCHSVPDDECHEVLLRVRKHSPAVKVLVLYESTPEICTEQSDKIMESLDGPATLLNDVRALMEEAAHGA
jgi:DNA-binding response OmpR family regulator